MSLHVLTYLYSRGSSSGVARHFVRTLGAPRLWGGRARPLTLGVGRGGRARPLIVGVGQGGRAQSLTLGSGEAAVSLSSATHWAVCALLPVGCFAAI
jgi:hypothetical protein